MSLALHYNTCYTPVLQCTECTLLNETQTRLHTRHNKSTCRVQTSAKADPTTSKAQWDFLVQRYVSSKIFMNISFFQRYEPMCGKMPYFAMLSNYYKIAFIQIQMRMTSKI